MDEPKRCGHLYEIYMNKLSKWIDVIWGGRKYLYLVSEDIEGYDNMMVDDFYIELYYNNKSGYFEMCSSHPCMNDIYDQLYPYQHHIYQGRLPKECQEECDAIKHIEDFYIKATKFTAFI